MVTSCTRKNVPTPRMVLKLSSHLWQIYETHSARRQCCSELEDPKSIVLGLPVGAILDIEEILLLANPCILSVPIVGRAAVFRDRYRVAQWQSVLCGF